MLVYKKKAKEKPVSRIPDSRQVEKASNWIKFKPNLLFPISFPNGILSMWKGDSGMKLKTISWPMASRRSPGSLFSVVYLFICLPVCLSVCLLLYTNFRFIHSRLCGIVEFVQLPFCLLRTEGECPSGRMATD